MAISRDEELIDLPSKNSARCYEREIAIRRRFENRNISHRDTLSTDMLSRGLIVVSNFAMYGASPCAPIAAPPTSESGPRMMTTQKAIGT